MKNTLQLIFIFFIFSTGINKAQTNSVVAKTDSTTFSKNGFEKNTITIKGYVFDSNQKPVPFVTVLLCSSDTTIIKSALTDSSGYYRIENILINKYSLVFRHIAYQKKIVPIDPNSLSLNKSIITVIEEISNELNGVTIVANKPTLEKIAGGFSYNVDNRFNKSTIWEVLKQTPIVDARDNGTLTILGKNGISVYINGRKSNLTGGELFEMLKNTSSDNLKTIDVITSPTSKYDAQGNGGILNIVMKKPLYEGLSGALNLTNEIAYYTSQRANVNLNYAKGKLTSQLGIRASRDQKRITEDADILLYTLDLKNNSFLNRKEINYPLGISFINNIDFSKEHTLSIQTNFNHSSGNHDWQTTNTMGKLSHNIIDSVLQTNTIQKVYNNFFNIDISDQLKLDSLGSNFSFGGSFFIQTNGINAPYQVFGPSKNLQFLTLSKQNLKNYAAQTDFHKTFTKATSLDVGLKANFSETISTNSFSNLINNTLISDHQKENNYKYNESILAMYSSFDWKISNRLNATIGFRIEKTEINGHERISAQELKKDYFNIFPNLSIIYTINHSDNLSLNINSRINRPAFWELNPTPVYMSPVMFSKGNAFLLPSRSTNFELSYMLKQKLIFIMNYSKVIGEWTQFLMTTPNSEIIAYTRLNYGNNEIIGFGSNYSESLIDGHLKISANLNVTYNIFKGAVPNRLIDFNSWQMGTRFRSDYSFGKAGNKSIYLAHYYSSPFKSAQGEDKQRQLFELGVKMQFNNLGFQIGYIDILNTGLFRFSSETPSISSSYTTINMATSRFVGTFSYSFGNNKTRKIKSVGSANDEQKNRRSM